MVQFGALAKLPFQLIFRFAKWTWNAFTGVVVRPIYEQSDCLHRAWRQNKSWERLTYGITYKLFLESVLTNDQHPISRIYIRNETNDVIDRIELVVLAEAERLQYPEVVVIPRLGPAKIASFALRNIPLQDVILEENGIRFSYDSLDVFVTEIVRAGRSRK